MRGRFGLRLRHRYFAAIMMLVTAAMAAVSAALIVQYERSIADARETSSRTFALALAAQFEDRARGLALVTAEALVNPLALLNVEGARDAIQAASAEPDVVSTAVVDNAGLALFSGSDPSVRPRIAGRTQAPDAELDGPRLRRDPGRLEVNAPVRLGDQLLGIVTIRLTTARIDRDTVQLTSELTQLNEAAKRTRFVWLLAIAGSVLVAAGASAIMMSRGLSRPIQALSAFTARIGRGDEEVRVAIDRSDEIGELARTLEAMSANLRRTMISRDAFDRILNSMQDGLLVTTPDGTITDVNQAGMSLLGRPKAELIGRAVGDLVPADSIGPRHPVPAAAASAPRRESKETWLLAGGGRPIPVLLSAAAMHRNDGATDGFVWVFHDITERKRAEEQIHYMAHHDALTGLPNRVLLHDRLQAAMAQARRRDEAVALLLLDLDDFKEVNDTLGHFAGDELLVAVAKKITACVRDTDTCARLGGDEFAIVQVGTRGAEEADALCQRLIDAVQQPILIHEQEVVVGTSIGVSIFPRDGVQVDQLLKSADLALYQAKDAGRRSYRFFQEELNAHLQQQKALERELRGAVQHDQLVLHYQPQIEVGAGRLAGVEALLRWHHPSRGLLFPDKFIPIAERTGLIVPVAQWVLREACAHLGDSSPPCTDSENLCVGTAGANVCCDISDEVCDEICGDEGECAATCQPRWCFPGNATVQVEDGTTKAMRDVRLGDRLLVAQRDGTLGYEEVYLNTHKDGASSGPYVVLALASGRALTLSPRHFIPVAGGEDGTWDRRLAKGADEVRAGDLVWSRGEDGRAALDRVVRAETRVAVGAYNPLTMNGTIVVDGVVASAHSDWFLDGVVSADTEAKVYQAILAPVRAAYHVLGPARMETITEDWGVVDAIRGATTPSGRSTGLSWAWLTLLPFLAASGLLLLRRRRPAVH